jgi:RHS repeat-associated protein
VNLSKEYGYRNGQLLITAAAPASVLCGTYDACGASPPEEIGPIGEPETGAGGPIQWLVTDPLGTPRMIFDQSGSLAGVSRHDYLPFGEELFSGTGGRTTTQGYSATDGVRQKFTEKERDNETGLDYFGARYYASTQGRFTSPDEFWKDSQIGDPQSWNKYAYVRNNPLSYIDPSGEKATVRIETDEEKKKGTIKITASIAIWTKDGKISKEDAQRAAGEYKKNIEKAWSGSYEQNGIKYEVSTTVDVQVYSSEGNATNSGAQNVLEVVANGGDNFVRPGSFLGRPDTGQVSLDAGQKGIAAHEFTHLLGIEDRYSGAFLSNTYESQRSFDMKATAYDFGWAFGGAINEHRAVSRQAVSQGRQWETHNAGGPSWGPPRSHTSTRELKAGRIWWH